MLDPSCRSGPQEEEAEYEARRAAAAAQLDTLKSKLGLAAAVADSPTAAAAGSKRVINIHAVSGSAAERMQQQASAAASMRSVLFERSNTADDGKLEVEMEAGKIGSRCGGRASGEERRSRVGRMSAARWHAGSRQAAFALPCRGGRAPCAVMCVTLGASPNALQGGDR